MRIFMSICKRGQTTYLHYPVHPFVPILPCRFVAKVLPICNLCAICPTAGIVMAVAIIHNDGFPTISPAQEMIDRAGILDAQLPWHRSILPQRAEDGKRKTAQICGLITLRANWKGRSPSGKTLLSE